MAALHLGSEAIALCCKEKWRLLFENKYHLTGESTLEGIKVKSQAGLSQKNVSLVPEQGHPPTALSPFPGRFPTAISVKYQKHKTSRSRLNPALWKRL